MKDTPDHIRRLYADFIMSKTDKERFGMGFEMADVGRRIVEEQFQQQNPNWSIGERKAAVFERIYRNDFSRDEMERIKVSLIAFYQSVGTNVL